jgi:ADP-dependent NAD(P)H-hydrate dehydratase / NAD(P)H-hydrate epimerase
MKVLTAAQVRAWDEYTMENEPISSIDLMERASTACVDWILQHYPSQHDFSIFCGKGNNGGDGLAIARLLAQEGKLVQVHVLEYGYLGTPDFQINLSRLHQYPQVQIQFIQNSATIHSIPKGRMVIDALFGVGLNRKLEGIAAAVVNMINESHSLVISIDMPSGLLAEKSSLPNPLIKANHTLTFECYKPSLLFPENDAYVGKLTVLSIGLHAEYITQLDADFNYVDADFIRPFIKPRKRSSHKGNYGHALVVAGSEGKMGAATLCAKGALRAGVGLLTCLVPATENMIIQIAVPEAMTITHLNGEIKIKNLVQPPSPFTAVGIGPGFGQTQEAKSILAKLLNEYKHPIVFDADALNILSKEPDLFSRIPKGSILTPHPKEFERLFGPCNSDYERMVKASYWTNQTENIIIIKGSNTLVFNYDKKVYYNSTGNPGMATGGIGDVLTGIVTSLLAQGYSSLEAALLGVYIHGLAGDLASKELSQEALVAGDIIDYLGKAWKTLIVN